MRLKTFRISHFGVSRCSGRERPRVFEIPVAIMPKWIFAFRVSMIPDAMEERLPCLLNSQ
jgi:hypothetical protein